MVKDTTHAKQEGLSQLEFWFQTSRFRKHDPKGLVLKSIVWVALTCPYAHEKWEDELFIEDTWKEVKKISSNPNITIFASFPLE